MDKPEDYVVTAVKPGTKIRVTPGHNDKWDLKNVALKAVQLKIVAKSERCRSIG